MLKRTLFTAIIATPLFASSAFAQVWDAPLFFSPKPMDEIGVYYFRSNEAFLGDDINGIKAIWRQSGNINLGVHAGFGDLDDAGNTILLGAELSNPISSMSSSGLAVAWHLGAGAVFGGDYAQLGIPAGISVGLNLGSGSTTIVPYANPRVSFDYAAVDLPNGNEITDSDFGFAMDLGVDMNLGSRLTLKAAYTLSSENDLGKRSGFGLGAALRIPRKVLVR